MPSYGQSYWQRECGWGHFGLEHRKPHVFVTSQCGPSKLYPVWTVLALLFHLVVLITDGVLRANSGGGITAKYFLYVTNWSYLLLAIYSFWDCVTTLYVHLAVPQIIWRRESNSSAIQVVMRNRVVNFNYKTMGEICTTTPWYLKLNWVLFTTSVTVAATVIFTYTTLYVLDRYNWLPVHALNATLLGENLYGIDSFDLIVASCSIYLHVIICAKPFKFLHFYYPVLFCIVYIVFTLVYEAGSGDYIYASVDWDDPFVTAPAMAGYVLMVVPLIHLHVHAVVYCRSIVGLRCQLNAAAKMMKRGRKVTRRNSKVAPVNDSAA